MKNQRVFFCQSIAWCRSKVVPIKELQCGTRRTESTVIPLYQLKCTRPFVHHISLRLVQLSLKASLFSIGSLASHLLRGSNARKTNDISTSASTLHFSIMESSPLGHSKNILLNNMQKYSPGKVMK